MPTFNANVLPSSTGFDLGSAAQRWDAFLQLLDVSGQFTAGGNIIPTATGTDLGSTTARWDAFLDVVSSGIWNNIRVVDGNKFTTLLAAFNDLPSSGGIIFVPTGSHDIATTLSVIKNNVTIIGAGGMQDLAADTTAASNAPTILNWTGGAADMIRIGNQATYVVGFNMIGCQLDGNDTATRALHFTDTQLYQVKFTQIRRCVTELITIDNNLLPTPGAAGQSVFEHVDVFARGALTAANGIGIRTTTAADPQGQTRIAFSDVLVNHMNGHGIVFVGGDGITFDRLFVWRPSGNTGNAFEVAPVVLTDPLQFRVNELTVGSGDFNVARLGTNQNVWIRSRNPLTITGAGQDQVFFEDEDGVRDAMLRRVGVETIANINDEMVGVFYETTDKILTTKDGNWRMLDGTGTGAISFPASAGGLIRLRSGVNANDRSSLIAGNVLLTQSLSRGDKPQLMVTTAPVTATTVIYRFGYMTTDANPPADGIYLEFDTGSDANWQLVTRASSTSTSTDTTIVGDTTKRYWLLTIDSTLVSVYTKTSPTAQWTFLVANTTNIPSTSLGLIFQVETLTAARREADIWRVHSSYQAE